MLTKIEGPKFFNTRGPNPRGILTEKKNGRYVPPRLSKAGSLELIFWLETGVSGMNFC